MPSRPWETVSSGEPPDSELLTAALEYAERGWPVFPCQPGGKHPITEHGFKDASIDELQIRRWWKASPKANIGLATGTPSGIVVVDVDTANGKSGGHSMVAIAPFGWATRRVETWSGGAHYYFKAPATPVGCRANVMPGIDTRANGGYVIAPPSIIEGSKYRWKDEYDIEPLPDSAARLFQPAAAPLPPRPDIGPASLLPSDAARIRAALGHLDAEPYDQWVQVGMALYELTGGAADALSLWDWWSASAPNYESGECVKKWQSFASDRGDKITEATFWYLAREAGYSDSPIGLSFAPPSDDDVDIRQFRAGVLPTNPPPSEFLIDSVLPASALTLLDGQGGIGKSMLGIQMAMSIASGAPFLGKYEVIKPGPAAFLTTEDDKTELARRVKAIKDQANFTKEQLELIDEYCYLIPWDDNASCSLTHVDRHGKLTPTRAYEWLEKLLSDAPDLRFAMLDPVVSLNGGNENYANEVRDFCQLMKHLMTNADTTLALSHHKNKSGTTRGSSDWVNACRNHLSLDIGKGGLCLTNGKRNNAPLMMTAALVRGDGGVLTYSHEPVTRTDEQFSAIDTETKPRTAWIASHLQGLKSPHYVTNRELSEAIQREFGCGERTARDGIKAALEDPGGLVRRCGYGKAARFYHASFAYHVERAEDENQ